MPKTAPKLGHRPRKPETEKLVNRSVRFAPDEMQAFEAACHRVGMQFAPWLRAVARTAVGLPSPISFPTSPQKEPR